MIAREVHDRYFQIGKLSPNVHRTEKVSGAVETGEED